MTAKLKYLATSVQNLEVMQYKETQANIKLRIILQETIYLLQVCLHAPLLHAPNRPHFLNKQVSKPEFRWVGLGRVEIVRHFVGWIGSWVSVGRLQNLFGQSRTC